MLQKAVGAHWTTTIRKLQVWQAPREKNVQDEKQQRCFTHAIRKKKKEKKANERAALADDTKERGKTFVCLVVCPVVEFAICHPLCKQCDDISQMSLFNRQCQLVVCIFNTPLWKWRLTQMNESIVIFDGCLHFLVSSMLSQNHLGL